MAIFSSFPGIISSTRRIAPAGPIVFTQQTSSFGSDYIYAARSDGTDWVAVGGNHKIGTATVLDPTSWSQQTNTFTDSILCIYGDGSIWTATGRYGEIETSPDTINWTSRTSNLNGFLWGVDFDGTYWVTADYRVSHATDPTGTWTVNTNTNISSSGKIFDIKTYGGLWVGVGYDIDGLTYGRIITTSDPTSTWTVGSNVFGYSPVNGIDTDGTTWVAVGNGGKIAYTNDPTSTWTLATSPFSSSTVLVDISKSSTYWIAVGQVISGPAQMAYATTPSGTWTLLSDTSFGSDSCNWVTYESGIWMACGGNGKLATGIEV